MIHKISNRLAFYVAKQTNGDTEILSYGLELLISTMINAILIIGIAFLLRFGFDLILYLCAFGLLRMSAGGYHAKTHRGCYFTYSAMSYTGIGIVAFMPQQIHFYVLPLLLLMSMILIYRFAPTQTPNRPIYPKERLRFRKRSIRLGYGLSIISLLLYMLGFYHGALIIAIAIFSESLTLIRLKTTFGGF